MATIIRFALHEKTLLMPKAKRDALRGLPRVLKERRRIQKTRRVSVWELRRVMAKGLLTPYLRGRA